MPMQRDRYPAQWQEIALQVKTEANWTCEQCGRECKKPGESWTDFIDRVVPKVHCTDSYNLLHEITEKPTRFVLTTAHLNHVPEDVTRSNLKALCSACHCRMDLKAMAHKKMLKREFQGQLNLFTNYGDSMTNYPTKGDKVVYNKTDCPPREVVSVSIVNDLIKISSPGGGFESNVSLEKFNTDYTKVE